jgi:NitT/TauT family transport system substrate-binding protein
MNRVITIIASAALAALVGVPGRAAEPEKVKVAFPSPIISFAAEFLAEGLFFKDQGLEVQSMEIAGIGAMNAVISGSVDFSFSSGGSLTRAAARGQKLLAIATLNSESGEYAVVRKDVAEAAHFDPKAPIAVRAQILKGHSFGIGGYNTIGDAYLRVLAKAGGVDVKDVTFAALQPPDIVAAMNRKVLDGFSLGPPWAQQVEHDDGAVIIADGTKGEPPGDIPSAAALLVTRPQLCIEHRSVCEKMGHSMTLAAAFMHEHPKEAVELLKKRFGTIDGDVLAKAFGAVVAMTAQPPAPSAIQLRNGDRFNLDAGFIKESEMLPSYDALFTAEFAK